MREERREQRARGVVGGKSESVLCTPALGRSKLVNDQSQSKLIYFGILVLVAKSFDLLSP
jgi:hypothetical protein